MATWNSPYYVVLSIKIRATYFERELSISYSRSRAVLYGFAFHL